jgi:hypothetical protein
MNPDAIRTTFQSTYLRLRGLTQNRVVRRVVQILVLAACLFYLFGSLRSLRDFPVFEIRWGWVAGSAGIIFLTQLLGGVTWWLILTGLGERASLYESSRAQLLPILAKYVPGYIWQYAGKALLTQETGVSLRAVGFALVLEISLITWTGIVFSLWTGIDLVQRLLPRWAPGAEWLPWIGTAVLVIGFAGLWLAVRFFQKSSPNACFQAQVWVSCIGVLMCAWFLLGLAFTCTVQALNPTPWNLLPPLSAVYTLAFLAGFLFLFIPNGIGVRESAIVLFLTGWVPVPGLLVALLARIAFFVSDLLGFGFIRLVQLRRDTPQKS